MELKGSCHCQAVKFSLQSTHPYPFNLCYCSICRKTAGGGGYAINLSGDYRTLEVTGEEFVAVYHARLTDPNTGKTRESRGERRFCRTEKESPAIHLHRGRRSRSGDIRDRLSSALRPAAANPAGFFRRDRVGALSHQ